MYFLTKPLKNEKKNVSNAEVIKSKSGGRKKGNKSTNVRSVLIVSEVREDRLKLPKKFTEIMRLKSKPMQNFKKNMENLKILLENILIN